VISSFKSYLTEEERTVFFTFGRMNPPTIGHEKLMNKLSEKSGKNPYRVYLSQTTDKKKNPLHFNEKVKFSRKIFPKHARQIMSDSKIRNVLDVASKLYSEGYKRVAMIVGSDRINEFEVLLNKYNGKKSRHGFYNFESIDIVSAGDRDPDADGAKGMSASKMRQAVMEKDFTSFSQGLPKNVSNAEAKKIYNSVRSGMGLKEQKEFKNHVSLKAVSETREKYIDGQLFNIGDKVKIKETKEIALITRKGSNYLVLENDNWNKPKNVWLDAVEAYEKMRNVSGFKTFDESPDKMAKAQIARAKERAADRIDRIKDRARLQKAIKMNRRTT